MGHQVHEPRGGLPAFGIVASHIGNAPGVLDIRVESHHRNPPVIQGIDTFPNAFVVVRGQGDAADFLLQQFLYGLQLLLHAISDMPDHHGAVISCQFLRLLRDAFLHIYEKGILGGK